LVATVVVLAGALTDQNWKFVPVFEPSEPLARVVPPQAKPLRFVVVPMLLPPVPAVLAVRVTPLPLGLAVTPEVLGQALMAVARFEARVDNVELVAKVAVGKVTHVLAPSVGAVGPLHA